jgi:hypothetical protein
MRVLLGRFDYNKVLDATYYWKLMTQADLLKLFIIRLRDLIVWWTAQVSSHQPADRDNTFIPSWEP